MYSSLIRIPTLLSALLTLAVCTALEAAQIPNHIFSTRSQVGTTVLVDKSTRAAYLIDIQNDTPRLVRSFDNLLFGANGGDKLKEGDKRTPEGVYRITSFIPDEKLAPIYGSGAFPIDYPNPLDRVEGRNGSGIWLHGRAYDDPDKATTRGCVAFNNDEIHELKHVLGADTPVIITRHAEFVSEPVYKAQRDRLLTTLSDFIQAWENGESETLERMLHPAFKSQGGKGKSAWINHKKRLNRLYPEKNIEADDIFIYKEDGLQVVFDFTQFYCASNIISAGKKRLYFKDEQGQLQLLTESFERDYSLSDEIIEKQVREFLNSWKSAWETSDIDAYMTRYSASFTDPKGRDQKAWQQYKSAIFKKRHNQRVKIGDIQIDRLANDRYQVRFVQDYSSDEYADTGLKTLVLNGCPGEFSIIAESWAAR